MSTSYISNNLTNDISSLGDLISCRDLNRFLDTPESIFHAINLGIRILKTLTNHPEPFYKPLRIQEGDLFQELLLYYQEITREFHSHKPIILIVDDDIDFLRTVKLVLEQAGFTVWSASNGKTALEIVLQRPDFILLDINMPIMDGIEVCFLLKHSNKFSSYSDIPVFFHSGLDIEKLAKYQLEAGADGFIPKNCSRNDLIDKISSIIPSKIV